MSSSIGASDRARQTDELRRSREEYEQREAEAAKKQKRDLRRLQEKHNQELAETKEVYEGRLDGVREKSRETLNQRDANHRAQVDQIREMYHEQLRRKTEDSEQDQKTLRSATDAEKNKMKSIAEQQRNELEVNFRTALNDRDREFAEHSENTRAQLKKSLIERTEKLNKKHENELSAVTSDRDRKVVDQQNSSSKQQAYLRDQIKDMDRRHRSEKARIEENWTSVVRDQAALNENMLENRNSLLAAERESQRSEYRQRIEDEGIRNEQLRENLKNDVTDRLNHQVRSAKYEARRNEGEKIQNDLTNNRLRKVERENLVQSYEARMRDLERRNEGTREDAMGMANKRIEEAVTKSDRLMQHVNRRNRLNQDMLVQRNREDRANVEQQTKAKLEANRERTDQQVGLIKKVSNESQLFQQRYYEKNLDQLKSSYADQLAAQREAQMETLSKIRIGMEEKLQSQQAKNDVKLDNLTRNYEEKIASLQESHKNEMARLQENYESRLQQRDKSHRFENEQTGQKYEGRMAQLQEEHQREMDRMQKRHQESLADVANKMSYLKKKA